MERSSLGQRTNALQGMGVMPSHMAAGSKPHDQPPLPSQQPENVNVSERGAGCSFPPSMNSPCGPVGSDLDMETLRGSLWQPHVQGPTFTKEKQGYLTRAEWEPREARRTPEARTPTSHLVVPTAVDLTASLLPPSPPYSPCWLLGHPLLTVP